MVLWLLLQNPTLHFAFQKEQYLPLKDFSRAWIGMVVATIGENVSHTGQNSLLPMRLFIPNPSFRTSFRSLTTCRADTYVSLGGSNGCADQLTNWDGHTEVWIRNTTKKDVTRFIQIMTMRGDLWRWLLHIASNYRNAMPKIKISNYLFFRLNKISYFCCQ